MMVMVAKTHTADASKMAAVIFVTARMLPSWFIIQTLKIQRRQIQTNPNAPQYHSLRFILYAMYFCSTEVIWDVLLK